MEAVLSGRERPDNSVGRKLLDLVNSVPKMTPDEFEMMINSNMKVRELTSILINQKFLMTYIAREYCEIRKVSMVF